MPNVWDRKKHTMTQRALGPRPKNPIGYEMVEISRVRVSQAGEISVLDIIRIVQKSNRETLYFP